MTKLKIKDKYEFIANVHDLIPHIREHMGDEVSEYIRGYIVDLEEENRELEEIVDYDRG